MATRRNLPPNVDLIPFSFPRALYRVFPLPFHHVLWVRKKNFSFSLRLPPPLPTSGYAHPPLTRTFCYSFSCSCTNFPSFLTFRHHSCNSLTSYPSCFQPSESPGSVVSVVSMSFGMISTIFRSSMVRFPQTFPLSPYLQDAFLRPSRTLTFSVPLRFSSRLHGHLPIVIGFVVECHPFFPPPFSVNS